ncbi:hypothetical protein PS900_03041 [Pseudomonas fluorescens]|uniref:Uncharacterized protein n=1 Tax=Pseudomonas fluorescens TaxID=294 RepID=A0A8H2NSS9_PSEFL|nr:hypothetical protein PS900_03041 [Pseudomonas fluorescens]
MRFELAFVVPVKSSGSTRLTLPMSLSPYSRKMIWQQGRWMPSSAPASISRSSWWPLRAAAIAPWRSTSNCRMSSCRSMVSSTYPAIMPNTTATNWKPPPRPTKQACCRRSSMRSSTTPRRPTPPLPAPATRAASSFASTRPVGSFSTSSARRCFAPTCATPTSSSATC